MGVAIRAAFWAALFAVVASMIIAERTNSKTAVRIMWISMIAVQILNVALVAAVMLDR